MNNKWILYWKNFKEELDKIVPKELEKWQRKVY